MNTFEKEGTHNRIMKMKEGEAEEEGGEKHTQLWGKIIIKALMNWNC